MNWFVYMIVATDGKIYTGITTNIIRRWKEHQNSNKGAKFFRGRKPERLLYLESQPSRSSATRLELQIKRLTREKKLALSNLNTDEVTKFYADLKVKKTNQTTSKH